MASTALKAVVVFTLKWPSSSVSYESPLSPYSNRFLTHRPLLLLPGKDGCMNAARNSLNPTQKMLASKLVSCSDYWLPEQATNQLPNPVRVLF